MPNTNENQGIPGQSFNPATRTGYNPATSGNPPPVPNTPVPNVPGTPGYNPNNQTTTPEGTPFTPAPGLAAGATGAVPLTTPSGATPLNPDGSIPKINTAIPNPNTVNANPFTQGLAQAHASGQPAPQNSGDAQAAVANFTAPANNAAAASQANDQSMLNVNNVLANDKGYQQLLADATTAKNTATQGKTLLQQYQDMLKASGIPGINTQLLNTQAIINGTEDDIRNEITAVGGWASDSQVLALSSARNKTLIQNYNNLLATKTNAEAQINTLIGLAGQDKQNAIAAANQAMQIDQQLADYEQKFTQNAKEGYQKIIDTPGLGYSGLLASLQATGTPNAVNLAEQTLGLGSGILQSLSTQQQNQTNLATIQKEGITTPYYQSGQKIINSKTGEAFKDPQDFQAKTGMSLDQAGAKGLISSTGNSTLLGKLDILTKQANLEKTKADIGLTHAQTSKVYQDINSTTSDKQQQALEQQYRQILVKEVSSRSGTVGTEDAKVAQANHLASLLNQYYDPKTGNYNVPKAQYGELVLGLAGMLSKTGTPTDSQLDTINQKTAKGDLNGAIAYITGTPTNGNTQAVIKNLADSIDRQARTAENNREAGLNVLRGLAPTDLNPVRAKALEQNTLVPFSGINGIADPKVQAMYTPEVVNQIRALSAGKYNDADLQKMVNNGYQPQQVIDLLQGK